MKTWFKKGCLGILPLLTVMMFSLAVQAKEDNFIKTGVYADGINMSGMTQQQATAAIEAYVDELKSVEITLLAADNQEVLVTPQDLGIVWSNPEIVAEALELGTHGNVIQRYKALKDLEHDSYTFKIEFDYDIEAINAVLSDRCVKYDREAVDVSLKKEKNEFIVVDGQTGYLLDVEKSIDTIYDYMLLEWNYKPTSILLDIVVDEPKGNAQELSVVQDVLASFTTKYTTSNAARSANVENGCKLINGITLYPGDEFSTYEAVAPFSERNGYYMAGSYLNGKVVDSLGGGICQVSTTLYNAVLLAELQVSERHNHSMIVSYVEPSADAAIAESSGKDFRFINNLDYPIYIEGITKDKQVTFNIYGKETRSDSRTVSFVSEILEENHPTSDHIYADASRPLGYIVTESAHIGYKAKLWKVVTENGIEKSREQVNSSTYKMSPRSATVGVKTEDPHAYEEIMAAIGTYSIDHVKNVIALLLTPPPGNGQ